jgi:hypothetical protein
MSYCDTRFSRAIAWSPRSNKTRPSRQAHRSSRLVSELRDTPHALHVKRAQPRASIAGSLNCRWNERSYEKQSSGVASFYLGSSRKYSLHQNCERAFCTKPTPQIRLLEQFTVNFREFTSNFCQFTVHINSRLYRRVLLTSTTSFFSFLLFSNQWFQKFTFFLIYTLLWPMRFSFDWSTYFAAKKRDRSCTASGTTPAQPLGPHLHSHWDHTCYRSI